MMTRKDFNSLAYELHNAKPCNSEDLLTPSQQCAYFAWKASAQAVAKTCKGSNPRFDTDKFMVACVQGLPASVIARM